MAEDIYRMRDLMHKNEYKDRRSRLASLGKPSLQSSGSHGALSGMHDSSDEGDDVPRGSNQHPSSSGNQAETSGVVLRAETTAVSQSMGGISKQELEYVWRAKLESVSPNIPRFFSYIVDVPRRSATTDIHD